MLIEEKHTRVRQPSVTVLLGDAIGRVLFVNTLVQEPECANDLAAVIGEESVGNAVLVGEPAQTSDGIVADGEDGDVLPFEVRQAALQLDELRFTKRSPFGAAMKHDQCAAARPDLVQTHGCAKLIWKDNIREMSPNSRADLGEVDAKIRDSDHSFRSSSSAYASVISALHST
jgi:hypothetical protein